MNIAAPRKSTARTAPRTMPPLEPLARWDCPGGSKPSLPELLVDGPIVAGVLVGLGSMVLLTMVGLRVILGAVTPMVVVLVEIGLVVELITAGAGLIGGALLVSSASPGPSGPPGWSSCLATRALLMPKAWVSTARRRRKVATCKSYRFVAMIIRGESGDVLRYWY